MIRVLMVLADTDRTDANLSAIDLHGGLVRLGAEVRTVALGPGRRGGLASLVPVLGPGRRSMAAQLQLRREQAWADVVVAHGLGAARVQHRAGRGRAVPVVVVLGDEMRPGAGHAATGGAWPVLAAATRVVATDAATAAEVASRAPVSTVLLRFGISPGDATSAAQRVAARSQLGLPADGPVLWWVGPPGAAAADTLVGEARRRGWPVLEGGGADDELVQAAADVAVLGGDRVAGPPRELLRAAASGCALVAPTMVGDGELVDDTTGLAWPPPTGGAADAVAGTLLDTVADAGWRRERGAAARGRAQRRFSLAECVGGWWELLAEVAPPAVEAVPPP